MRLFSLKRRFILAITQNINVTLDIFSTALFYWTLVKKGLKFES